MSVRRFVRNCVVHTLLSQYWSTIHSSYTSAVPCVPCHSLRRALFVSTKGRLLTLPSRIRVTALEESLPPSQPSSNRHLHTFKVHASYLTRPHARGVLTLPCMGSSSSSSSDSLLDGHTDIRSKTHLCEAAVVCKGWLFRFKFGRSHSRALDWIFSLRSWKPRLQWLGGCRARNWDRPSTSPYASGPRNSYPSLRPSHDAPGLGGL